jgi:hypothetical protein
MKCSAKEFRECVKEFRQFGYDPYNSADDNLHWYAVMDGREEKHILARSMPAC